MGEGGVATLKKPGHSQTSLILPSRNPAEALFQRADNVTPSPMTLVASFFADHDTYADSKQFPSLSAGALVSPDFQMGGGGATEAAGIGVDTTGRTTATEMPSADRITARYSDSGGAEAKPWFKPAKLPITRSPCLTIPPGLSPTMLLDSSMFYSPSQVDRSSTLSLPSFMNEVGSMIASDSPKGRNSELSSSYLFKPFLQLPRSSQPSTAMASFESSFQQEAFTAFGHPQEVEQSQAPPEPMEEHSTERGVSSSASLATAYCLPHLAERPSDDGYNWKKYGQKQVKGSEYPRSYYKCTHPSCPVKKTVERSFVGEITEIIYKGEHNHAKPQGTRRSGKGGVALTMERSVMANEKAEVAVGSKVESDRMSADLSSSSLKRRAGGLGLTPESDEEVEGLKDEDDAEVEQESNKRRRDGDANLPIRTIREPRVVVQTTSEVDILDDGYRWRKYGQKVVRGNSHPRSYYKCTNVGCRVTKQVERSSADSTAVITTYKGKHNHDVPASRSHARDVGALASSSYPSSITRQDGSANMHIPQPERPQQGLYFSSDSTLSFMSSAFGSLPLQETGLRPKEEPDYNHQFGMMMQPAYLGPSQ